MTPSRTTATRLLCQVEASEAPEPLLPVLYDELRQLANRLMRGERNDHTLQATALVHEAWGRLIDTDQLGELGVAEARRRFLVLAGRTMRRVLIDHARAKGALRRGGDWQRVTIGGDIAAPNLDATQLLDLEAALVQLEATKPRLARVAELRLFAGLSSQETAVALDIGLATAIREWATARALLTQQLSA